MGHIFISYSHRDMNYAYRLTETLQASGFEVWIDTRLDYGSQWPQEIQKQLDGCEAFILIMTPRSFASDWVQSEFQRAKRKMKPIFPLLLEGDETWLSVESTQFYDMRGGQFPDTRFYPALKQAVSVRHQDLTLRPWKPAVGLSAGKIRTIFGAVLGIVTTIALGLLAFRSPVSNPETASLPAAVATSTIALQESSIAEREEQEQQQVSPIDIDQSAIVTVFDLEPQLQESNIILSTGRGYFTGPESAYHMLAVACLQIVGDRQFRQTAYLDMIEKWYAIVVREENYLTSEGRLHLEQVKEAMVKAHNEYHGDDALLLEEILLPNPSD